MKVADVVASWTPEEREKFKDLIDECTKREIKIEDNRRLSLDGLKRIIDAKIAELAEPLCKQKGRA